MCSVERVHGGGQKLNRNSEETQEPPSSRKKVFLCLFSFFSPAIFRILTIKVMTEKLQATSTKSKMATQKGDFDAVFLSVSSRSIEIALVATMLNISRSFGMHRFGRDRLDPCKMLHAMQCTMDAYQTTESGC